LLIYPPEFSSSLTMQFIDQVEIQVQAGNGGDGLVAFRREKYVPAGGPSGGNGGNGGSVILLVDASLQTLLDFRYNHLFKAEDGERGGPKNMTGATGSDRLIEIPCGTMVFDAVTAEVLGDLTTPGQSLRVAQGGKGGLGNKHFLSNRNRAPEYSLPGLEGETRTLRLELKLLAEVGIIGLPNAGKSTLISVISSARPKIADYPFTTLIPNLGVVRQPMGDGTVFADIPGLIAGAHLGTGLGHDFLRHIERTRLLLHLIDATSPDAIAAYQTIQSELAAYGHGLSDRPQILVLNKIDAVETEQLDLLQSDLSAQAGVPVFTISAVARTGLESLLNQVWQTLESLPPANPASLSGVELAEEGRTEVQTAIPGVRSN
jgi:GTPase